MDAEEELRLEYTWLQSWKPIPQEYTIVYKDGQDCHADHGFGDMILCSKPYIDSH